MDLRSRLRSPGALGILLLAAALVGIWVATGDEGPGPTGPLTTGTGAPDPGGDEEADVPVPPSGVAFGFNEAPHVEGVSPASVAETARAAGANAARFVVDWRLVEQARDVWDEGGWAYYEAPYEAALAAGLTPVITFGFAPAWARSSEAARACDDFFACRYPPAEEMNGEWAEFSMEVARRFPRAVLEVWNEPNLAIFWRPVADPERFAELQILAYVAIKSVDPSVKVLAGGLSGIEAAGGSEATVPGDMALGEYLARAYESDPAFRTHMDALSFHPYPLGPGLGAGSLFAAAFSAVRTQAQAHGDHDLRLWVTETGVTSAGANSVSDEEQEAITLRLYRRVATMKDVDGLVLHRLFPPETEPPGSEEWGYALATGGGPDGTAPKPAFCALVSLAGRSFTGC